jgi:DNA-binding IclR family transcriptional regulator
MADIPPPRGHRPAHGEPVVDRVFRVLGAFSAATPDLSLVRISEAAALPLSTTLRLCRQLLRVGALERRRDGSYVVGIRMLEIAALAPRGHGLRTLALPYMEDLHRATGEHVQLAVREGEHVIIVERLSAPSARRIRFQVGSRIPLHESASGPVLLAHADPAFQDAYLARQHRLQPEDIPVDPPLTSELLAGIRSAGWARFAREHPAPIDAVAAPVFDRTGACVAALSVLAARGSFDGRTAQAAVVAVSRAVSRDVSRLG